MHTWMHTMLSTVITQQSPFSPSIRASGHRRLPVSPGSACCQIHPPWPRTCFKTEVLHQFPLLICSRGFHFAALSSCLLPGRK